MAKPELAGWTSTQRVDEAGAVESTQSIAVGEPVVEPSEDGARELSSRYWAAVRRFGRGLLSVREHGGRVEIRLLGIGPRALVLGEVQLEASDRTTTATHEIVGGLLVRRAGGRISFEQVSGPPVELRSRITGFYPRRGPFYGLVQRKLHVAVSRRYFGSLTR